MSYGLISLVFRPFPPPVFDRLQYANMEGEGLGDLVTCSYIRQGSPMRNLEALSNTISLRAGGQSVSKAVSIPSVVHSARDGSTRNGNFYCRAPPPICLPSVYLTLHITKSPRPSPSIFAYCKRSNTGGGNGLGTRLWLY